eukprot:1294250-Pyramimonas_sp.AAC.1
MPELPCAVQPASPPPPLPQLLLLRAGPAGSCCAQQLSRSARRPRLPVRRLRSSLAAATKKSIPTSFSVD